MSIIRKLSPILAFMMVCFAPRGARAQLSVRPRFDVETVDIAEPFEKLILYNQLITSANVMQSDAVSFTRRRRIYTVMGAGIIAAAAVKYPWDKTKYTSSEYINWQAGTVGVSVLVALLGGVSLHMSADILATYRQAERSLLEQANEIKQFGEVSRR